MKGTTLFDISRLTGLSLTTISRVLNGRAEQFRISQEAQAKIMDAVKKLNYRPNHAAQSLRKNATNTIGLLVPNIDNPFFAHIASAVIKEAYKYSYTVILVDSNENVIDENRAIEALLHRNVDGIIMVPTSDNPSTVVELERQIPVVLVDRYYENCDVPFVASDNYSGAYEVTKMLVRSGHNNIMCIQGTPHSITSRSRVRGYHTALTDMGLQHLAMVGGNDFTIQNGYVETKLMLSASKDVSAIFALSNTILLGALRALKEHRKRVPDDLSIVSFDDNTYLDFLDPPITRIVQPLESICILAVKMLIDCINHREIPNKGILLQPSILHRESIGTKITN